MLLIVAVDDGGGERVKQTLKSYITTKAEYDGAQHDLWTVEKVFNCLSLPYTCGVVSIMVVRGKNQLYFFRYSPRNRPLSDSTVSMRITDAQPRPLHYNVHFSTTGSRPLFSAALNS